MSACIAWTRQVRFSGSTDQHAYVQQLRDGTDDFFATFLNVRRDRRRGSIAVEEGVTTGDYLSAFWEGTRAALTKHGRESMTITFDELNAHRVGVLLALFERAVGLYAELINVNAYNQPGVEAGKRAAGSVLELQAKILTHLQTTPGSAQTVDEIAAAIGTPEATERIYHILEHAAANTDHGVRRRARTNPFNARYIRDSSQSSVLSR